jgi:hypothetical protein
MREVWLSHSDVPVAYGRRMPSAPWRAEAALSAMSFAISLPADNFVTAAFVLLPIMQMGFDLIDAKGLPACADFFTCATAQERWLGSFEHAAAIA